MSHSQKEMFIEAYSRRSQFEVAGMGTYHVNYKLVLQQKNYILRVPISHGRQYDIKSLPEDFTLDIISKAGYIYSPQIIFASQNPPFSVLDYFCGEPIPLGYDISEPIRILNCLHDLTLSQDLFPNSPWRHPLEIRSRIFGEYQMRRFAHILEKIRPGLSAELRSEALRVRLSTGHRVCLLHGDPARSNFLLGSNGDVRLIDFELAAFGDALLDFALLLNRASPADFSALQKVLSNAGTIGTTRRGPASAKDLLGYAIVDVARSIHVVAAKFFDPLSPLFDRHRGERRLAELIEHRAMLRAASMNFDG